MFFGVTVAQLMEVGGPFDTPGDDSDGGSENGSEKVGRPEWLSFVVFSVAAILLY